MLAPFGRDNFRVPIEGKCFFGNASNIQLDEVYLVFEGHVLYLVRFLSMVFEGFKIIRAMYLL